MSFQQQVNQFPAPGIPGEFASTNPRHALLGAPGGLVAGATGLTCGAFAWLDLATFSVLTNFGAGAPNAFIHNAHTALITTYLGRTSLVIPGGFAVGDAFDAGDFWCTNPTGLACTPGQTIYANNATGVIASFGAAANGGTSTASSIAAIAAISVTGSIAITPNYGGIQGTAPTLMTVTAVGSGTLYPGVTLSGAGVVTGTIIVAQISGTPGGIGVYSVSIPQTVASTTITGAAGVLTVGGTVTGTFSVGDTLSGAGITAGSYITALGTGTGGAGTYIVSASQTVTSEAINALSGSLSPFFVASFGVGAANEVIKITNKWP